MLRIEFKKEEIDKIRSLNKTHLHPFVRQKSNVLLLKANNISHGLIAQICDISENTLRNYFRGYMESGIESLTEIPFYKQQSKLTNVSAKIVFMMKVMLVLYSRSSKNRLPHLKIEGKMKDMLVNIEFFIPHKFHVLPLALRKSPYP